MRPERVVGPIVFSILVLFLAAPAFSQIQTGTITGRAVDGSGALIPGVEVSITSPAMIGGARSAPTDELGAYRFSVLPPGTYRVSFALPGFKTLNIEGVNVAAGATMTIVGTMEVASVAEEVTVTSQAPQIDLEAATVGVNWGMDNLDKLPYGKGIRGLSQMIPGIYTPYYDVGGNTLAGSTTVSGRTYGRTGNELMQFEGAVSNDTLFGDFGTYAEVQYSAAAKGAEAQNAGVSVSFTIKSGGNDFHGSVAGSYQPGRFQSNNVDDKLLRRGYLPGTNKYTHYDDWSGELGGPILKNRLTFYSAFSHNYAGQFIPGFVDRSGQQVEFFTRLDTPTLKLTYQLNPKMRLEFTEQIGRKWQPYRGASAFVPREATQNQKSWGAIGPVLKWVDIISPRMTVDASINRAGYWWPDVPWTRDIRQTDLTTTRTRGEFQVTYRRPIRWGWNATWSWFRDIGGKNNEIKSGVNGHWSKAFTETAGYPDSNQQVYRYRSLPGDTNFFLRPNSVQTFDYPNTVASGVNFNSWFVNDKVTWNRKLTINAGIRFDRYSSWLPEQGNPGTGPWSVKRIFPERRDFPIYNSWSPRFSFVYDVKGDGKLALKASYGKYTGAGSSGANGPVASSINPAATIQCTYNNWDGSIPYRPVAANLAGSCTGGGGTQSIDPGARNYWTDEYTSGIEVGLSRNYLLRFNAVRKMDFGGSKTLDRAQPLSAYSDVRSGIDPGRDNKVGTSDDNVVYVWSVPRAYPTFGQVNQFTTNRGKNEGSSLYTGYDTTFNKQFADKWSFLAGLTLSYSKRGTIDALTPNNLVYGRLVPQWDSAFKMNGTYELPMGFRYAATFQAQSGDWYGRTVQLANALGTSVNVQVEQHVGRYQWVKLWDNRISKTVKINEHHSIEGTLDIFNTANVNTVVSQVTSQVANGSKADYGIPVAGSGIDASAASSIIAPRILRFAARWRF